MEKYNLTQTGQEVQNILNNATPQSDLASEVERAQEAERLLGEGIQQNATDIDSIEGKIPSAATSENKLATIADVTNEANARETADNSLSSAIEAILLLIPSAATSLNKLADKAFVNSSIATNTATFRGTFNLVNDLHLMLAATHAQVGNALALVILESDNNDYAFVQIPTVETAPTEIAQTDRYKFNGSTWEYEYTLNNSGYTAVQWAAINSGITEALVTKLSALPTNTELTTALGVLTSSITTINQKIPSAASQANQLVDTASMESYIVQVLDVLTASFNVTSSDGHVTVQISQVDGKITSVSVSTSDIASAASLSLIAGRVTTAEGNISTNAAAIEAILLLIPSAATSLNKLADKAFVNSSIATATATFRGTYNLVTDLDLTISATYSDIASALADVVSGADNNDYAFVQIPTSDATPTQIAKTVRFKFNGTSWEYEYDLNNSGYTAAQWAAINSGITAALVAKLDGLPTADALQLALNAITQDIDNLEAVVPTEATSSNQLADKAFVLNEILLATTAFKGQFTTLAQLQAVTGAKTGDIGIVRTKDHDGKDVFTFYQYKDDQWNEFYTLAYHPQDKPATTGIIGDYPYNGMGRIELPMNMVDGWPNDTWLYLPVNGVVYLLYSWNLQLYAVYNSESQEGLGLENNIVIEPANYDISDIADLVGSRYLSYTEAGGVFTITKPDTTTITSTVLNNTTIYKEDDTDHHGINLLTQSMLNKTNTIYVIQYDFDLGGETVTIPENCILEFEGGNISNGSILGNNTNIKAGLVKIFSDEKGFLAGTFRVDGWYPEWFGAIPILLDKNFLPNVKLANDCTNAIQRCVDYSYAVCNASIYLTSDIYGITKPIILKDFNRIIGNVNCNSGIAVCDNNSFADGEYLIDVDRTFITTERSWHLQNVSLEHITLWGKADVINGIYRYYQNGIRLSALNEGSYLYDVTVRYYKYVGIDIAGDYVTGIQNARFENLWVVDGGGIDGDVLSEDANFINCVGIRARKVYQSLFRRITIDNHFFIGLYGFYAWGCNNLSLDTIYCEDFSCSFHFRNSNGIYGNTLVWRHPHYKPVNVIGSSSMNIAVTENSGNILLENIGGILGWIVESLSDDFSKIISYAENDIVFNNYGYFNKFNRVHALAALDIDKSIYTKISNGIALDDKEKAVFVAYNVSQEIKYKVEHDEPLTSEEKSIVKKAIKQRTYEYYQPQIEGIRPLKIDINEPADLLALGKHKIGIVNTDLNLGDDAYTLPNDSVLDMSKPVSITGKINTDRLKILGNIRIPDNFNVSPGQNQRLTFINGQQAFYNGKQAFYISRWEESDGAVAGVARSGDLTRRPIGSYIYIGFMYFDTSLGKPIYANSIDNNLVDWRDADGNRYINVSVQFGNTNASLENITFDDTDFVLTIKPADGYTLPDLGNYASNNYVYCGSSDIRSSCTYDQADANGVRLLHIPNNYSSFTLPVGVKITAAQQ